MNKMKDKKCDFCEHHRPESPYGSIQMPDVYEAIECLEAELNI